MIPHSEACAGCVKMHIAFRVSDSPLDNCGGEKSIGLITCGIFFMGEGSGNRTLTDKKVPPVCIYSLNQLLFCFPKYAV